MKTKVCSKCGKSKSVSEFYKHTTGKDGLRGECKVCNAKRCREYRAKNSEKIKAVKKRWRKENYGKWLADARKAYHKRGYEYNRDKLLQRRYGVNSVWWNEKLNEQKGCCAVCGVPQKDLDYPLYTDHSHKTGQVRGLLCRSCNWAVGALNDNLGAALSLIKYLEQYE